jgi:DNA-binding MarR family transcriptional regulator
MLQLRKLLIERAEWFEQALARLAEIEGYGHLPPPVVQMCKFIGKEPVRMTVLAEHLGVSRQRVAQIAADGAALGILELGDDPDDGRVKRVGYSEEGWNVVRRAVARMSQIEGELARRTTSQPSSL